MNMGLKTLWFAVALPLAAVPIDVSFERDVISILTTKGCNSSGCHGSPAGQSGFKLSLYGSNPAADHAMIVEAAKGRRVDLANPGNSLFLKKPSFGVPHGGGNLMTAQSDEYQTILQWLSQGAKLNADGPRIVSIQVEPREAILRQAGATVQFKVVGRLSDGTTRDMTREVRYAVNDEAVVKVSPTGLITAGSRGLTVVMARGLGKTATAQFIVLDHTKPRKAALPQSGSFVDREVFTKLGDVGLALYPLSSDPVFLRRVYLDAIGILPTPQEAQMFFADTRSDKRTRLIDQLLERPEYTTHWLVKFEDWFRNSQYYSQGRTNGSFKRWLSEAIRTDKPYSESVREMLTATGDTTVHPAGNFWHPAMDFMLKTFEVSKATPTVTRLFLGQRIECAECHNHPLENLTQDEFYGMAAFMARLKVKHGYAQYRRIWYNDRDGEVLHPVTKKPVAPRFLDGATPALAEGQDRRKVLADWILGEQKLQFARATVNRVWAEYFTAGIVDPPDDFRSTNMPSHPALLDQLAEAFIAGGYRFKPVHRLILNSMTYQASSRAPGHANGSDSLEKTLLARYEPRKLSAEVLLDSIGQLTGVAQSFPNYPEGTSSKELVASIGATYFLTAFGHPRRDSMEARSEAPSMAQALHLMNADAMREKLEAPNNVLSQLLEQTLDDRVVIDALYIRAYSRPPDDREVENAKGFLSAEREAGRSRRRAFENVLWALMNSKEFQLNQ